MDEDIPQRCSECICDKNREKGQGIFPTINNTKSKKNAFLCEKDGEAKW